MTDWKKKALEQWENINRAATRRFGDNSLAEEAALAVMNGLEDNNWRRLRAYSAKASFSAFVGTLTARLLEDFARSRFGRIRPPLWVKALGGIWTRLFSALCLERLKVGEAVEVVFQRQGNVEKRQIEEAAYTLLGRIPDCGGERGYEVGYEENRREKSVSESLPPGESVEEDERNRMLHCLLQMVVGEDGREISEDGMEKLKMLHIELQPLDRMLLKLCFQEEMGVTEAGRMLGQTRFQAHGRMRRVMRRIRGEFERIGIDRELRLFLRD